MISKKVWRILFNNLMVTGDPQKSFSVKVEQQKTGK